MNVEQLIEAVGKAVDVAGVSVIVLGAVAATAVFAVRWSRLRRPSDAYTAYRQTLGRAILLGLEFLVAADIIRTVAITPTFRGVGVLAGIVLIRTFLSFTLELEIDGRWPWQRDTERERRRQGPTAQAQQP